MTATVHPLHDVPGPQDTAWVDAVLTALAAPAALLARALDDSPGYAIAFGATTPPAPVDGVTIGPGTAYDVLARHLGRDAGPARFAQLSFFTGHDAAWAAAFDRSGAERVWPAVRDLPGLVSVVVLGSADGARLTVTLADSIDALEAAIAAILSSPLLPWEDPADLTGPTAVVLQRLLHADLPAAVG